MKLLIEVEERVTRSLIIDTDDYSKNISNEMSVFEIAEFINEIKEGYNSFFESNEIEVEKNVDVLNVKVSEG